MIIAVAFALLNLDYLVGGCGVLWLLGVGNPRMPRVDFVLLAYSAGVATTGVSVALLAIVNAVPGRTGFSAICIALLVAGWVKRRYVPSRPGERFDAPWTPFDTAALVGVITSLVVVISRFYRWPLGAWDGWAIWSLKTHALYVSGGVSAPALHTAAYTGSHLDYPLLLPGLETVWLRFLGHYSGELLHLQLVCFLAAFAAGLLALLRQMSPPPVRMLLVVAIVSAPAIINQLVTNYADIPLALFVALGVLYLARWLLARDHPALRLAAVFFAAATLTKSEGMIFAGAAFLAAVTSRQARGQRAALAITTAVTFVPVAVWRTYTTSQHLTDPAYDPALLRHPVALAHRMSRLGVAFDGLAAQGIRWDLLLLIPVGAGVVALHSRRYEIVSFAARWGGLSFIGLLIVYWISVLPIHEHVQTSADRIVASLVLGLLALTGIFAGSTGPPGTRANPGSM